MVGCFLYIVNVQSDIFGSDTILTRLAKWKGAHYSSNPEEVTSLDGI